MKVTPELVKNKLDDAISSVSQVSWLFASNADTDFTRDRKLPMDSLLRLMLKFGGKSLQNELTENYLPPRIFREAVPTKAAFSQQRKKLLPEGCYTMFRTFTDSLLALKTMEGYRLLACDGSTVPIPRNEEEEDYSVVTRKDRRSYNQLHFNGLFDVLNRIFVDCIIDPGMHMRERAALINMVHRLKKTPKDIILADRGYEGYNDIAHMIESGVNFLIRGKDLDSNGFLHTLNLPADGEIDIDVDKILMFNIPRDKCDDPSYVKVHRGHFDFLKDSDSYPIHFRLVRIKLSDESYECLVTNLPRDKFPPQKLKKIYHLRWGIENAYRDLKFSVDLLHFHGKSAQAVLQEIYCSLTMFNFCAYLCVHADILHVKKGTKYQYKVNFANAVGPCKKFLHGLIDEAELLYQLRLSPTPIRPNRQCPRPRLREQSSREFNYRAP